MRVTDGNPIITVVSVLKKALRLHNEGIRTVLGLREITFKASTCSKINDFCLSFNLSITRGSRKNQTQY